MKMVARTLSRILDHDKANEALRKKELRQGDQIVVATENSIYTIIVAEDSTYQVAGGWFDRHGAVPTRTAINGCTWGGSIIQTRIVAARGLRLEFGNRVVTSPVREFWVIRSEDNAGRSPLATEDQAVLAGCGISWEGAPAARETDDRGKGS